MNRSALIRWGDLARLFLGIIALGSFAIFEMAAQQNTRSKEMKSSPSVTMTFTAGLAAIKTLAAVERVSSIVGAMTMTTKKEVRLPSLDGQAGNAPKVSISGDKNELMLYC